MTAALLRYRVLAYVVGTMLLILLFVAVPVKYLGDHPGLSSVVSPVHGVLFMVYLVVMVDLGRRVGWPARRMLVLALAGVVPFLSFVAERRVVRELRGRTP